ncbi:unnamed protein product [Amoebophrya sp. A120]|nr:unnamed protein product [Amoebophrya sp. A120]|eukprot:GSA120T00006258001.1
MGNVVNQLAFPAPDPRYSQPFLEERGDQVVYFKTSKNYRILAVYLNNEERSRRAHDGEHFVILYSHGNAEDVGLAIPYLEELTKITECSVFAYEYEGYSLSDGEPTEQGCYRSVNAAYKYLTEKLQFQPSSIFVFGRSIGSGPSTDLASRLPSCAGLVLQSPIESGARAVFGSVVATVGSGLDIFKNIEKIERVRAPVCIMHGEADEVVPITNGRNLYKRVRECQQNQAASVVKFPPLWIPNHGHNDMPEHVCLHHVSKFIKTVLHARREQAGSSVPRVGGGVSVVSRQSGGAADVTSTLAANSNVNATNAAATPEVLAGKNLSWRSSGRGQNTNTTPDGVDAAVNVNNSSVIANTVKTPTVGGIGISPIAVKKKRASTGGGVVPPRADTSAATAGGKNSLQEQDTASCSFGLPAEQAQVRCSLLLLPSAVPFGMKPV